MSEKETITSAGLNGGFEVSRNHLPVNWLLYSPNTVPNADFTISLDSTNAKEGDQSLKFEVLHCSPTGGWYSPGFTNEFTEAGPFQGESTYTLSFWIKNEGTQYRVLAGGVSPFEGEMKIIVDSEDDSEDWQFHEFEIYVPKDRHLRMELNVLKPGSFWIDDVKISK